MVILISQSLYLIYVEFVFSCVYMVLVCICYFIFLIYFNVMSCETIKIIISFQKSKFTYKQKN